MVILGAVGSLYFQFVGPYLKICTHSFEILTRPLWYIFEKLAS